MEADVVHQFFKGDEGYDLSEESTEKSSLKEGIVCPLDNDDILRQSKHHEVGIEQCASRKTQALRYPVQFNG